MPIRLAVMSLLCVLACGDAGPTNVPTDGPATDQRAVIEAVLHHVGVLGGSEKPLFEQDAGSYEIYLGDDDMDSLRKVVGLDPGVVSSFVAANVSRHQHEPWLGALGVGLIDAAALDAAFTFESVDSVARSWEHLLRGPPECTVLVSLSMPGFSESGNQAMISVDASRGVLNGNGGLYLLKRQESGWVVIKTLRSWVS